MSIGNTKIKEAKKAKEIKKIKKTKKTTKRIICGFVTILTKTLTFVASILFVIFSLFLAVCVFLITYIFFSSYTFAATEKLPSKKFQEAMQYANSIRSTVSVEKSKNKNTIKVGSFKLEPEKAFIGPKTKKNWYTDNPTQTSHYGEGATKSNIHGMKKEAIAETTKDENYKDKNGNPISTPGKTIVSSFQNRPLYKVTADDEYIKKGNLVVKNAKNIVTGSSDSSDGDIRCESGKEEKKIVCKSTYEQKICNEEVRTIKRICEKVPHVTFINDPYPGCQKHVSPPSIVDCLAKHIPIPDYRGSGHGDVTLPQNRGARVGFSDSRHPHYYITAVNKATGEKIFSRRKVSNGVYLELPTSKAQQDQTFSFTIDRHDHCSCNEPGRMKVYINHMRRIPKIEWKEVSCRDI